MNVAVWRAGIALAILFATCSPAGADDPLPSWNATPARQAIIAFVERVARRDSPDYVASADRIATFDNDGTLWCEKPLYIHVSANLARFQELIKADPRLAEEQPYKAIVARDQAYFLDLYEKHQLDEIVGDVLGVPFEHLKTDEYAAWNRRWLDSWKHPRFNVGYRRLVYQPMVELVRYLHGNEFQVHIFTADEGAFVKLVSEELYGIPPERAMGSSVELEFAGTSLVRTGKARFLDNWDGKPRYIYETLGKRPLLAAGNSNGDLEMLQYAAAGAGPRMAIVVHHTDDQREYAYDKHTEKLLPEAQQKGWTIIDMKADWNRVFPGAQ
jgi:phosphoglycolate phosphatase-like HAD superfamily hydrolase